MSNHRVHATRTATALAAVALAAVVLVPAAHAADTPAALGSGELAAARSATQQPDVLDKLGQFFARKGVPPTQQLGISAADEARAAVAAAPRLTGDTVPVYTLSAAFVAGRSGTPVAEAGFTATAAVAADGQRASVWTAEQNGGWRVVNIASGSDETDYAARAAADGGTAFREPQIGAWYEVKGDRVLPLDDDARRSVGARGTTVAAYQQLVHQRYGDKLPGSGYDASGKAGGFEAAAGSAGSMTAPVVAGAAVGLTALAGTAFGLRRRKVRVK
ncbi:hypothetical protein [Kitasatospora sp. NPDC004272]